MGKIALFLLGALGCVLTVFPVAGQEQAEEFAWPVNAATSVGAGRYQLMDTYLSPGSNMDYGGWALRVQDERMKFLRRSDGRVLRQQVFQIDFTSALNPAGSLKEYGGFIDYTLGYHYCFPVLPGLRLLAGGAVRALAGGIYNMQSSNNPGSGKADLDLNLSGMALYRFRLGNFPMLLRYQFQVPFAGILFSPHYGQPYYEIFQLGNAAGVVQFASFHNKLAIKNTLTLDWQLPAFSLRFGYSGSLYKTDVNGIQCHLNSRYFMVGFVREFVAVGGKRSKSPSVVHSIYE